MYSLCIYQGCCVAICEGLKYIVKNMAESQATVMLGVPLIFESMHKKVWKQAEASGKADKMRKAIQLSKTLEKFNLKSIKKLFKSVHQAMGGNMRMFHLRGRCYRSRGDRGFQRYGHHDVSGLRYDGKFSDHRRREQRPLL